MNTLPKLVGLVTGAGRKLPLNKTGFGRMGVSVVTKATREHERDVVTRHWMTDAPSLGGNSWRKIVRNRITVCCEYGDGMHGIY